ncbi:MAG: hypothetical protein ACLFUG_04235, partial [Nitriliruptoraceae bacterium]
IDPAAPAAIAPTLMSLAAEEVVTVSVELADLGLPGTELVATADRAAAATPDGSDGDGTATGQAASPDGSDGDATGQAAGPTDPVELALRVADHLGTSRFLAVGADDAEARAAALARLTPDVALLPLPSDLAALAGSLPDDARLEVLADGEEAAETLVEQLTASGVEARVAPDDEEIWAPAIEAVAPGGITWLADPSDGTATAVAAVAATGRGEALLPVSAADLRAGRTRTDRLRAADPGAVALVGAVTEEAGWQLATVLEGEPLPGGGFRLFEDERIVALYGSVETPALGVLGEQGVDATIERARTVAAPYGADGARVLPTLEIITTIASASPEPTGDYSRRTPIEVLRPWIDRAGEEGLYVFLDLQPGRTDFLTQAKEYEELLLEPNVGLALDPEWRLAPDELHLEQIGSVPAAEVQQVADWLAALTRENRLPQKLLVLHQFRFSMLPDRDTIAAPPELAVVIHMDGQGPIGAKYQTYEAITAGAEDRWLWGWKNFYDEDVPTPTPEQVLDLDPLPVLVTYQ